MALFKKAAKAVVETVKEETDKSVEEIKSDISGAAKKAAPYLLCTIVGVICAAFMRRTTVCVKVVVKQV